MSVQYNVSTLLREPVGSTRNYDIDSQVLIEDHEAHQERIVGHATFLRTKSGVLVTAQLVGAQRERCSRCLKEIDAPLEIRIEEEFFASVDPHTGASLPAPEDPEAFRIDARHTLDLEDAVRQYWTSALPMQPLCRTDCRGLCPRCGQDLNEGACSCSPEEETRWSALGGLAKRKEGS